MFCFCQKSQVMNLMDDMILLAASPRTTGRRSTGMIGSICSTLKFPPAKISLKDFPSMFDTSTPTHSSGGKKLRVGIIWLNIACLYRIQKEEPETWSASVPEGRTSIFKT